MRKRLITGLIVAAFLSLSLQSVASQRKPAPDEALFTKEDYYRVRHRVGWRLATESPKQDDGSQTLVYYDPKRVTTIPGAAARPVWLDELYPGEVAKPVAKQNFIKQAWIKTESWGKDDLEKFWLDLDQFDCETSRMKLIESHEYNGDGDEGRVIRTESEWSRIIPDTRGDRLFGILCLSLPAQDEREMNDASELFRLGRQAEKKGQLKSADIYYSHAQDSSVNFLLNTKIIAAITRVRRAMKKR